jgi:hypothetical protein
VVISIEPEAPAGIWHVPETQIPLAQSGPVEQIVFGSVPGGGMQSPPSQMPLSQSLAWVHGEPAGAPPLDELVPPELTPPELTPPVLVPPELVPPLEVEPPVPLSLAVDPPEPPAFEP